MALTIGAAPAGALHIRSYEPARHDRLTGFPGNPAPNASFYLAGSDFSGVGWSGSDTRRQFTLVSPKHFVGANHFRPAVGDPINFLGSGGEVHTHTVAAIHFTTNGEGENTDLILGELTEAVDPGAGISFVPYLNLASEAAYANRSLRVYGIQASGGPRTPRVGAGRIGGFSNFGGDPITGGSGLASTRAYAIVFNNFVGGGDDAHGQVGDSGSPSFADEGGRLAVVGIHSAVLTAAGSVTTYDSFIPHYADQLNDHLAEDGYHLTDAIPGSTTLAPTWELPGGEVAAGAEFTAGLRVANSGGDAANNLTVAAAAPAGTTLVSAAGTGWVCSIAGDALNCRRGGLDAGASSVINITFRTDAAAAGEIALQASVDADESDPAEAAASVEVTFSYASWSAGLADPDPGADPDGDGLENLLEFAFGGDGGRAGLRTAGGMLLSPRPGGAETATDQLVIRHLRRENAGAAGLSYDIEVAAGLVGGGAWLTPAAAGFDLQQSALPLIGADEGLEEVTVTLTPTSGGSLGQVFARVRVTLDGG